TRLYLLDLAAGNKVTELVKGEFQISDPQWSPSGREIAFVTFPTPRADDFRYADLMIVDAAGGATRTLFQNPGPDTDPRWSPDGSQIAFRTKSPKSESLTQSKLVVVPAGGGAPRELASGLLYEAGPPTWSPDGQTVYFWTEVKTR